LSRWASLKPSRPARQKAGAGVADKAGRTRDLLARNGNTCPTVTGASTFEFEAASGVYTELQCGSYIFMDAHYGRNLDRDGAPTKAFEPSLFVWATVMSRPTKDRAMQRMCGWRHSAGMTWQYCGPLGKQDNSHAAVRLSSANRRLACRLSALSPGGVRQGPRINQGHNAGNDRILDQARDRLTRLPQACNCGA
jgi:hypothetical protein